MLDIRDYFVIIIIIINIIIRTRKESSIKRAEPGICCRHLLHANVCFAPATLILDASGRLSQAERRMLPILRSPVGETALRSRAQCSFYMGCWHWLSSQHLYGICRDCRMVRSYCLGSRSPLEGSPVALGARRVLLLAPALAFSLGWWVI